jgi:hypothetical protein
MFGWIRMTVGTSVPARRPFDLYLAPLESLHPLLQGRCVHAVLDGRHDAGNLTRYNFRLALQFPTAGCHCLGRVVDLRLIYPDELGDEFRRHQSHRTAKQILLDLISLEMVAENSLRDNPDAGSSRRRGSGID